MTPQAPHPTDTAPTTTPTPRRPRPASPTPPPAAPGAPELPLAAHVLVRPWLDPVVDQVGHDPRSAYVEQFWLATLGPSTTWLMRRLVGGLDDAPDGYELDLAATARSLGLGARGGRNSPFVRALERSRQFGLTRDHGVEGLAVRRRLPPLSRHQVARLPEPLREAHAVWQRTELRGASLDEQVRRARRLALCLFEVGEGIEGAERQLHRWRFHPALAHQAVAWAWDRHRVAAKAAAREAPEAATFGGDDAA